MCKTDLTALESFRAYQAELVGAGLLIPSGVPGVYGRSGVFEDIVERFDAYVTRMGGHGSAEVIHFPPVINRAAYARLDHMESFPDLMGSVHSFMGGESAHAGMLRKKEEGKDWTGDLDPTRLMMVPAACYSLYPTATGTLPEEGRLVDIRSFVFRHEPSEDPARMQIFRMREYVRLGSPAQALEHRNRWIEKAGNILRSLGLDAKAVVANDPFFGRGGRMMAATQKEQNLKYELVAPICLEEKQTALASCNYHQDHFGKLFGIVTQDGESAHSACMGFGMERVALALFKAHGFAPASWPASVRAPLGIKEEKHATVAAH